VGFQTQMISDLFVVKSVNRNGDGDDDNDE